MKDVQDQHSFGLAKLLYYLREFGRGGLPFRLTISQTRAKSESSPTYCSFAPKQSLFPCSPKLRMLHRLAEISVMPCETRIRQSPVFWTFEERVEGRVCSCSCKPALCNLKASVVHPERQAGGPSCDHCPMCFASTSEVWRQSLSSHSALRAGGIAACSTTSTEKAAPVSRTQMPTQRSTSWFKPGCHCSYTGHWHQFH